MQRIPSLDIAKGFTVLIMPMIHVVMIYSKPEVQQSLLGDILAFIAEGPGAQLFMLLMGVGIVFSKRINSLYVIQRTLLLLIAAYLLNVFKFIIPLFMGWMPENLLQELGLKQDYSSGMFFLLLGDILHFAAIAFYMLFFIYRLRHYQYWSLLIALAVMLLSPLVWDIKTGEPFIDVVLTLFNGHPPETFFPVFPWLVYPLIGLSLGYFLKHYDINLVIKRAGLIGIAIMVISCLFPPTPEQTEWLPFYRTAPADTLFHIGFVLAWLFLIHWLTKKFRYNPFKALLIFCSKNITAIYIIQWVMICWGMAFIGYQDCGLPNTFYAMMIVTAGTLLLTKMLLYARNKH